LNSQDSSYDSELCAEDEDEEGQIKLPAGIIEDINDIKPNNNYLLVFVRHKTEEEVTQEKEVSEWIQNRSTRNQSFGFNAHIIFNNARYLTVLLSSNWNWKSLKRGRRMERRAIGYPLAGTS
jgi:hypothetical protein